MDKRNVAIVGAGEAGVELARELGKHPSLGYHLVGFVDDAADKQGKKVQGVSVIGTIEDLETLITKHHIQEVLIAIPSAQGSLIRKIINQCQNAHVIFRIVPRVLEIIQGKVHMGQVRPVQPEDVLGRAIRQYDQKVLEQLVQGKRVLVTGAAGSIGSELCRQLLQFHPEHLVMLDWWENGLFELDQEFSQTYPNSKRKSVIGSIQDKQKMDWLLRETKPQLFFHAAAFKHVPLMEDHPEEAVKNNIIGTRICAEMAARHQVEKFVFISTDKAVNPQSVMGASKLFAELLVGDFNTQSQTKFISVRFGNVLGSYGSVVPIFQKQIAQGGPVTVTDPAMVRYFMTIPEAVQLILQAAYHGKGGEVFMLDMGEPVKVIDLARTLIRLSGFEPDKEIAIKIIGKRPGEKLVEELLTSKEQVDRTAYDRLFVTKNGIAIGRDRLWISFDRLTKLADQQDKQGILKELKTILPNFIRS